MRSMVIGIVGAGAIGTLFAAALARAGAEVRVLVRDAAAERDIARRGGILVDEAPRPQVTVSADATAMAAVEALFVAVKTYATAAALEPLRDVVPPAATVVSLQNGIGAAERIAAALGPRQPIALGVTTEGAVLIERGHARHTARGTTRLGWARGCADREGPLAGLAAVLNAGGLACELAANIEPHVWAKLIVNAALNPITALAGVPNGRVFEDPVLGECAAMLAREAAAVAVASGIDLPFDDPVEAVELVARATAANRSSMLQDLEAGRPTEIEALNGAIVARACALGIAVPENARITAQVRTRIG